jgi:hypothetical protein
MPPRLGLNDNGSISVIGCGGSWRTLPEPHGCESDAESISVFMPSVDAPTPLRLNSYEGTLAISIRLIQRGRESITNVDAPILLRVHGCENWSESATVR